MKNLLIPFTAIIWAAVTYFCLSYLLVAQFLVTGIGWFWLFVFYTLIIGIVSLLYTVASSVSVGILYIYKFSWLSTIVHCLCGIIGLVFSLIYYIEDDKFIEMYSKMWDTYPVKTILLTPGFAALYFGILYVMVINPILVRLETKDNES